MARLAQLLLGVSVAAAIGAGILSYASYRDLTRAEAERERMSAAQLSWITLQMETELLRVGLLARRDGDAPSEELFRRYQVLESRMKLADTPELRETLAESVVGDALTATLDAVLAEFEALDALLASRDMPDGAKLDRLAAFAERRENDVARIANTVFAIDNRRAAREAKEIARLRETHLKGRLALLGAFVVLALSLYAALHFTARLARRADRLRRRLSHLLSVMPVELYLLDAEGRLKMMKAEPRPHGIEWREGQTLREHLRAMVDAGAVPEARGREAAWIDAIERRLTKGPARHLHNSTSGRRLLVHRTRSPSGETLVTGVDVTEQIEARQRAEALSAERAVFLATLSHEIRTPIATMKGALDLADGADTLEEMRRNLERGRAALQTLLRLSRDLFDFTTFDAEMHRLAIDRIRPAERLRRAAQEYTARAEAAGLDFELLHDVPEEMEILSDSVRIRQILDNLVGNAIKYTDMGGVLLNVRMRQGERRATLEITVSDTGRGIARDDVEALFMPFRRASAAAEREPGLGLGLWLSREAARRMGGELRLLRTEPGKGSAFEVAIPVEIAPTVPASIEDEDAEGEPALAGLRVLLVEDNHMLAEVTEAQLRAQGWEVTVAHDVASVRTQAEFGRFDAALVDLGLPDGSGLDVARLLANRVPTICALTAYVDAERERRCLEAGMHHVMVKPFDCAAFGAMIEASSPQGPRAGTEGPWLSDLLPSEALAEKRAELQEEIRNLLSHPGWDAETDDDLSRQALRDAAHAAAGAAMILGAGETAALLNRMEARLDGREALGGALRRRLARANAAMVPDDLPRGEDEKNAGREHPAVSQQLR